MIRSALLYDYPGDLQDEKKNLDMAILDDLHFLFDEH